MWALGASLRNSPGLCCHSPSLNSICAISNNGCNCINEKRFITLPSPNCYQWCFTARLGSSDSVLVWGEEKNERVCEGYLLPSLFSNPHVVLSLTSLLLFSPIGLSLIILHFKTRVVCLIWSTYAFLNTHCCYAIRVFLKCKSYNFVMNFHHSL